MSRRNAPWRRSGASLLAAFMLAPLAAPAQDKKSDQPPPTDVMSRERNRKQELKKPYKDWLNEDVAYIIRDEERKAFKKLATDEEREQYIEAFWRRRDPDP